MDEQQMNEGLLCDTDRQLIGKRCSLAKICRSPRSCRASWRVVGRFAEARFHSVCVEVETLEPVWPGLDFMSLVSADWREAFSQGALRMHNAKTISLPTHIEMANGEAVELSISENAQEGGPAWFLSYVPIVEHMKLRRDCVARGEGRIGKAPTPQRAAPCAYGGRFCGYAGI